MTSREEADTIPAPPPEPTEPANEAPKHPFHIHLDECEQCHGHPFGICNVGVDLYATLPGIL